MGLYPCTCAGYMFHFCQGKKMMSSEKMTQEEDRLYFEKNSKTGRFDRYKKFTSYLHIPVLNL